ncbi:MAG: MgtC/SapB family protein [Dermatophilaceae bacterium]
MTDYLNALEMQGLLVRLLVSVGIGFLIGLEREYSKRVVEKEEQLFAGVRTFTLITLFGFLSALLAENYGGWILGAAFLGFFALLIVVYRISAQAGNIGGSTEMSSVLAFLLGAVVFEGHVLLAIIATVIVTSLLSFKLPLHRFVATMTMEENPRTDPVRGDLCGDAPLPPGHRLRTLRCVEPAEHLDHGGAGERHQLGGLSAGQGAGRSEGRPPRRRARRVGLQHGGNA